MKTMYTVTILQSTKQAYRTINVATLSECVQLTLGLETGWQIRNDKYEYVTSNLPRNCHSKQSIRFYDKYKHSLRSLVAQWKCKYYDNVAFYRMDDTILLSYLKIEQLANNGLYAPQ